MKQLAMRKMQIGVMVASFVLTGLIYAEEGENIVVEEANLGWENSVDFALILSQGNTKNMLLRVGLQTEKKDEKDAYKASVNYNYGEEESKTNEDEVLIKASWKHNFARKNIFGLRFDGRRDEFADIDYRVSVNATYGYYWLDTEMTIFSTELGAGLTTENTGGDNETHSNGLFVQYFEHKFNDSVKVYQHLSFAPRIDHIDDYRSEFVVGMETKITETIAFRASFENRYENMPAANKEKNSLKFLTGLSYKF